MSRDDREQALARAELRDYPSTLHGAHRSPAAAAAQEFVTEHTYDPSRYFFDRSVSVPRGMLEDCRPLPMPSRAFFAEDAAAGDGAWRDQFAISIGADLQGYVSVDVDPYRAGLLSATRGACGAVRNCAAGPSVDGWPSGVVS